MFDGTDFPPSPQPSRGESDTAELSLPAAILLTLWLIAGMCATVLALNRAGIDPGCTEREAVPCSSPCMLG